MTAENSRPSWRAQRHNPDLVGIPTKYRDRVFRSRLEARWAAFFDLIEWPWEYEPIDLSGYVPDFVLTFPRAPLLVEVKPEFTTDSLNHHFRKIALSGWRKDVLLVGARLFPSDGTGAVVGALHRFEHDCPEGEWSPDEAALFRCSECRAMALRAVSGSWMCLGCGQYKGNEAVTALEVERLEGLWADAANLVRWRRT